MSKSLAEKLNDQSHLQEELDEESLAQLVQKTVVNPEEAEDPEEEEKAGDESDEEEVEA